MKSQADCWRAILDGETLVNINDREVELRDGKAMTKEGDIAHFTFPNIWSIKLKHKMYYKWKKETKTDVYMSEWTTRDLSHSNYIRVENPKTFEEIE